MLIPVSYENIRTRIVRCLSVLLCALVLLGVNTNLFHEQPNLALFGMLGLLLVLLERPFAKRWADTPLVRGFDILCCLATVVAFGYVFVQSEPKLAGFWIEGQKLGDRAGMATGLDTGIALLGFLLVLETTRRAIGWTLPVLCGVFVIYALFGAALPDAFFPHRGFDWSRIVNTTFLQSGVFGIALKVMFMYVFLFVLFGSLLESTGATGYVINMTRRLFRRSTGGPAKVAVLSSGLMGSLSGSAVANTATTGTFTIPLMRSSGFSAEEAGGIEAAASSGGALMPPIMGAGAYMMLELLSPISYLEIIKAALIPAALYYTALLLTVHFRSLRIGANPEVPSEDTTTPMHAYQGLVFFGSFASLIILLLMGFTPFRAVSVSLVVILIMSRFSTHTRITRQMLLDALVRASKGGISLIVAASCVGIILGIVTMTGIGTKLPNAILPLAQDSQILALMLLMIATIILGMGLPSAVCYLLMANLVGKVLGDMGTPLLAAHLFIFYFGMMSMVTPPVALAAYTAAAIAKGKIMQTAFAAFKYALVGFALPYAFVLRPALLMLDADGASAAWSSVLGHVTIILVGICGLAACMVGHAFARIGLPLKAILFLCSFVLFLTRPAGTAQFVHLTAAALILGILAFNYGAARKQSVSV